MVLIGYCTSLCIIDFVQRAVIIHFLHPLPYPDAQDYRALTALNCTNSTKVGVGFSQWWDGRGQEEREEATFPCLGAGLTVLFIFNSNSWEVALCAHTLCFCCIDNIFFLFIPLDRNKHKMGLYMVWWVYVCVINFKEHTHICIMISVLFYESFV